jgi:hypothetical protein
MIYLNLRIIILFYSNEHDRGYIFSPHYSDKCHYACMFGNNLSRSTGLQSGHFLQHRKLLLASCLAQRMEFR